MQSSILNPTGLCLKSSKSRLVRLCIDWFTWRLLIALNCANGFAAPAVESDPATRVGLTLQGFGTLGVARTNDPNAEFIRDLSQPKGAGRDWTGKTDSMLGLQANIRVSPQTEGVVQMVSRYRADATYSPELTWAFLRYDATPDLSLRAGRLGTEFYMLGDSRLVGYSNLTLRPPPDFYGSLVFSYIDGLDAQATFPVSGGLLSGKLFAGLSPEETPFVSNITWNQRGSSLVGGYLNYMIGPWQARLSHAGVRFERETPTDMMLQRYGDPLSGVSYFTLVPEMAMVDSWARFSSIGLTYDQGPLNIQLMLNRIEYDSPAYFDSKAGYLLAAYRKNTVTTYVGMSRSLTSNDALPSIGIPGVDGITQSLVAQSAMDQYTYTLGGRWDFRKNLALKAQADWIRGKPTSAFLFKNVNTTNWDGNMLVYSLALDFVF